jgi:hypothetical protein
MVRDEGGRWDVSTEEDEVYLERIDEDDDQVFDDYLTPDEARALAGLLNKFADQAEKYVDDDADYVEYEDGEDAEEEYEDDEDAD